MKNARNRAGKGPFCLATGQKERVTESQTTAKIAQTQYICAAFYALKGSIWGKNQRLYFQKEAPRKKI